jgi:glycosyltransferase involved in cell wall biosynthesis
VIHCTSEQEKRDVAELISKYDHIEVVPIPVEGQTGGITKKLSLSSLVLGYLGRIHPKKNLSLLLKSISELPSKSTLKIQLEIAGEGEKEYVKQLKQQAITHGIQENINWLGFLSGKRKEDFFDRIHYYILPSHHENFGIAVAEALAHGVPVLISDNVDLADEVLSYKAGWVINLKQDDLTEKLTQLIQIDPAKYSQRVQQAYKLYQEMLTPEQINHRLKSIYERCLGS